MARSAPLAAAPPAGAPVWDPFSDAGETGRWTKALGIVLAIHAIPLLIAAYWIGSVAIAPAPEPAIMIDMAPLAAPPAPPSEEPPGPEQVKAETPRPIVPREVIKTPPVANPAAVLPVRTPEPEEVARKPATETTAPAARPAPPAPRASTGRKTWEGMVLAHLDKHKRFPRDAQFRREQGVPYIRFVMDRNGKVLSSRMERSSGFRSLDGEAVALPKRAQPLPKPPEDMPGDTIELVVPVEFFLR